MTKARTSVLLIRSAEFAVTPALPRFANVLAKLLPENSVYALCWRTDPDAATPFSSPDASVVHFERRGDSRSVTGMLSLPMWWARIWRELRSRRHAVVQASDVFALLPVVLARPMFGYRVVADVRDHIGTIAAGTHWGWKAALLGRLERVLLTMADNVVVVEESRKDLLPARVVGDGKVVVVRNVPVSDLDFTANALPAQEVRINYSGHLSRIRGAEMLLAAASASGSILEVIGDVPDPDLRKQIEACSSVLAHGRMSHADAMRRMKSAHAVALLYDPFVEANRYAAPNKFYEAMMLGRPVIASEGTPVAEWVRESDCGWVVQYGDAAALAAVLRSIKADRPAWAQKCANARRLYESRFTWEKESAALVDMYRRLLGQFALQPEQGPR